MFKATTNLFGNEKLTYERKNQGPIFSAKKGTNVKTNELMGSNPLSHEIPKGNNFTTKDNRAYALTKVHGSSGMSDSLFSGHDNAEVKRGNERNKKTDFHFS
jgi:hypothetical protein